MRWDLHLAQLRDGSVQNGRAVDPNTHTPRLPSPLSNSVGTSLDSELFTRNLHGSLFHELFILILQAKTRFLFE